MQLLDIIENVATPASLVALALVQLLPLLSDRVNKRAVRMARAKNKRRG